jgi:hypothetical protein
MRLAQIHEFEYLHTMTNADALRRIAALLIAAADRLEPPVRQFPATVEGPPPRVSALKLWCSKEAQAEHRQRQAAESRKFYEAWLASQNLRHTKRG